MKKMLPSQSVNTSEKILHCIVDLLGLSECVDCCKRVSTC